MNNLKMNAKAVDVAVGVLVNQAGQVLLAQRPLGKPYAGYWEFPGGKVEAGEAILAALARELSEELGVQIDEQQCQAWCCCAHHYPHAHVHLHFYICRAWTGNPYALEQQQLAWQSAEINLTPLLPATIPLLDDLMHYIQNTK